jgi:hypothetical protein
MAVAIAALLAGSCGPSDRHLSDSAVATRAPTPPLPAKPDCPNTGKWKLCTVQDRLEDAGLAPQLANDTVHRAFLHAPGRVFRLGPATLEVYLYADTTSLARDVAKLDTVHVTPRDTTVTWSTPPVFVRTGNLAAILLSSDDRQIERVQDALTAGLPPPEKPPEKPGTMSTEKPKQE